ncbi:AfsR/SARP family transcriptional regulator [Streptomyces sparsogenes]|uniref:SARP family transcriptional regulator n=1 Tax=Streptomyces sparsogenes DSM 40356 TaxID=1331668 RepID=A0A1R1SMP4_9ACTN|nr:BTAD domain-containing putative transcriptional regulator [Streptomyces sparsogenes]OMI39578.1 SARP family transcriptional regulator [Streptomyces sparsogenes DSM 40356]
MLGPVRAWRDGTPVDLGPVRRQAVLVAMVLRPGLLVSHEQLLDGVWGAKPPKSGRRVLPSYVYALRKALDAEGTGQAESVIRGGRGGYRFVRDGVRLDVGELGERAEEAQRAKRAGDAATAADRFSRALDLFGGEPLAGLPGPFARVERQRLVERRRSLRRERLDCLVVLGRYADALDELAALSAADPYDESLLALRMRALYGSERQAEALNAFQDMRERLRDELGVDPGEELRRVYEAVLRRDDAYLLGREPAARPAPTTPAAATPATHAPTAPAPATPAPTPAAPAPAAPATARRHRPVNDLPGDAGHLTGREPELAALTTPPPPASVSIVTVDGPAGVGKSALVVRAAHELRAHFPDGCLYVDLRAHSTGRRRLAPQRVLRRLLRSLGAADNEVPGDLDELTAAWRAATSSLRLLLVLDDALGTQQIRPLLPAGPGSMAIAAGRRRLAGLDADRRISLEPLGPSHAVSLLRRIVGEERADREPEATRELVRLCDGLPLALRIAGTRLQTRPSWTLAYLVDRMAGDERRLGELTAGDRSVEAAFRLSYDQLTPEQQRGFRTLGLAPTVEFDPLTSAAMLGRPSRDAERILEGLVDTSLVQQPRPGRYRLHDLVRVHARRIAEAAPAEAAEARTAALRLYLDAGRITSDWGPAGFPSGPEQSAEVEQPEQPALAPFTGWRDAEAWLAAAGAELADVVGHAAALGEADYACWIAEALTDHLLGRGRYHECRTALKAALAHADEATDQRMPLALRSCMGMVDIYQGRYPQARAWFTEALDLSRRRDDRREEARALSGLGTAELNLGQVNQAIPHITEAVELSRRYDDHWLAAMGLSLLGALHHLQGQNREALACFDSAHAHAETNGRPRMLSRVLTLAADVHVGLGDYGQATTLLRRAADLVQQAGDTFLAALTLARLGSAEQGAGNLSAAITLHHQALSQHRLLSPLTEPHYDRIEMDIRCRLGRAYAAEGRVREAQEQFRLALAVPRASAHPDERAQALAGLEECEAVEGRVGEVGY